MRQEFAIDIHRPPRDVFAVVGNLENDPKWQATVISASKITPRPIAEGARFRHIVNIMGRRTVVDMEFVHHLAGERYVLNCSAGMLEFNTEVRFEPIAEGTRLVTLVAGNPRACSRWRRSRCRTIDGMRSKPTCATSNSSWSREPF